MFICSSVHDVLGGPVRNQHTHCCRKRRVTARSVPFSIFFKCTHEERSSPTLGKRDRERDETFDAGEGTRDVLGGAAKVLAT